jgi:hypothetical protein
VTVDGSVEILDQTPLQDNGVQNLRTAAEGRYLPGSIEVLRRLIDRRRS